MELLILNIGQVLIEALSQHCIAMYKGKLQFYKVKFYQNQNIIPKMAMNVFHRTS